MHSSDDHYYYSNPSLPLPTGDYGSDVILPSAEAHFYDVSQAHAHNDGSGINVTFPNPSGDGKPGSKFSEDWWNVSGLLRTYPEEVASLDGKPVDKDTLFWRTHPILSIGDPGDGHTGTFYYVGLRGEFSNTGVVEPISDFNIFNHYIHHILDSDGNVIFIPYVSDYIVSTGYVPYKSKRYGV
jgi:hypothetical protein